MCTNKHKGYTECNNILNNIYEGRIALMLLFDSLTLTEALKIKLKEDKYFDKKCKRLKKQLDKDCKE